MRFRPCIDLRNGQVVQIVGSSLRDTDGHTPVVNFETTRSPASFALLYRADDLRGGHVIALGSNNHAAALEALQAWPGGLQMGGGITPASAEQYLAAGASHVIVTSYVFRDGQIDRARLRDLVAVAGKDRVVLDLSCRKQGNEFWVVTDRWQRFTEVPIRPETLADLADSCAEFLVHGVDVEGKRAGIEAELVELLGQWSPLPVTYAGGVRTLDDMELVRTLGQGRVDLTVGSALDIFGGNLPYRDVVAWQRQIERPGHGILSPTEEA